MRILHVIPSLDRAEGGPSHALPLMEHALAERGHEVITASTVSSRDSSSSDSASNHHLFPRQSEFYKVSLPLTRWVKREVRNFDLVHIHALFSHSSVSAARCAAEAEIPFIIRPLGVLNQYGVQNRRRWLKKWSIRICEAPLIRKAAAMHFTSEDERKEAEMLGIEMNSKVIPLGIKVPDTLPERKVSASRTVLFLSRLDPKKNIESLLEAWSLLPPEIANTWTLKIAGNGDTSYVNHLKELSRDLQVAQRIEWCGFVEGASKDRLFEEAELYILPSFSENFGIAAVEAMGHGIPSILSPGVAVGSEAAREEGCFLTETTPESISEALSQLMLSPELRDTLSRRGHEFVRSRYGIPAMTDALESLYLELASHRSLS